MLLCAKGSEKTNIFCFVLIPDLTFKWRSQRTMMYHYLTEMGFTLFKRQYDLYLNSKVAPDTRNDTGLWLSLKPESKIVPLIYSHGDYSTSERITHFMVILCESCIKQNKQTKTQQMQSLRAFLWAVQKQLFLTIKLPFTVVCFFLYTLQRLRNDRGICPRQTVSKWIFTQCELTVP